MAVKEFTGRKGLSDFSGHWRGIRTILTDLIDLPQFDRLEEGKNLTKTVVQLFILSTLAFFGVFFIEAWLSSPPKTTGVLSEICRFDCFWYEMIAEGGYHEVPPDGKFGMANWAFWPLFPMLASLFSWVLNGEFYLAAIVLNNAAILGSLLLLQSVRAELNISADAFAKFCIVFLATPFILYLRVPYSEAVYNLFFVMIVVAWLKNKPLLLAAAGIGFTVARGTGVFLPVFLGVALLMQYRLNIFAMLRADFKKVLAIAVMPVGFSLHAIQLGTIAGDPLAFTHVHRAWQAGDFENPLLKIYNYFFVYNQLAEQFAIVVMALGLYLSYVVYKKFPPLRVFVLFLAFTVLMSFAITPRSFARYSMSLFLPYLALPYLIPELLSKVRLYLGLGGLQAAAIAAWLMMLGFMV